MYVIHECRQSPTRELHLSVSRRCALPRMCLLRRHCALWYCCLTCPLPLIIHCYSEEESSAAICRRLRVWLSPKDFHSAVPEGRGRKWSQGRAGRDPYSTPRVNQLRTVFTHVQLRLSWSASPWGRIWKHLVDHRPVGESEESTLLFFPAVITLANMVNVPNTHRAFCEKCGEHQPHRVMHTRRAGVLSTPRESGVVAGSRVAVEGRLSRFSGKRLKLQRRWYWVLSALSPTADQRECWLLADAGILSWEVIRRERSKWSSFELHILFYYEE